MGGAAEADAVQAGEAFGGAGEETGLDVAGEGELMHGEAGALGLLAKALVVDGAGGEVGEEGEEAASVSVKPEGLLRSWKAPMTAPSARRGDAEDLLGCGIRCQGRRGGGDGFRFRRR